MRLGVGGVVVVVVVVVGGGVCDGRKGVYAVENDVHTKAYRHFLQ